MNDLKKSRQEVSGQGITKIADSAVAPALMALGVAAPVRLPNQVVQTVTTNVPGPQFPIYMLGRQVVEFHPYVPITGGIQVAIAIFSYLGRLYYGLTGDFDGIPDLTVLADGIGNGIRDLVKLAEK